MDINLSMEDQINLLIVFQLYLHDRKLITDYDWDYEKMAKRFVRSYNKSLNKAQTLPEEVLPRSQNMKPLQY